MQYSARNARLVHLVQAVKVKRVLSGRIDITSSERQDELRDENKKDVTAMQKQNKTTGYHMLGREKEEKENCSNVMMALVSG